MTGLRATLRLQFHQGFTLDDAVALVPYFHQLGISHLYASPLLMARAGSTHGYDVVDPTRINPELGGEDALERLITTLRRHDMGLLLDIVSNHMAVGGNSNPWWLDVLEWGQHSPYATFFDIEWQSPDPLLHGQLLVPFLATDYGEALTRGDIPLRFDAARAMLYLSHFDHWFPLYPPSYSEVLKRCESPALRALAQRFHAIEGASQARTQAQELRRELGRQVTSRAGESALQKSLDDFSNASPDNIDRLHRLLERQHYRLASWRTASDDINWRRFFDVNELGALRVENPQVFEATHAKIFELIEKGWIDGLRIDHVDGLANPRAYCRKLSRRIRRIRASHGTPADTDAFPIYVEKILGEGESLPTDWQVTGTTGYEFMNQVSLLQHDPEGETTLSEMWAALSGRSRDFMDEVYEARKFILAGSLAGDLESVAQGLLKIARMHLETRDMTLGAMRRTLNELIAHFPVYRTYASPCGRRAADETFFMQAFEGAHTTLPEADWPVLDQLSQWLGGESLRRLPHGEERHLHTQVISRFQQLTSATAAKAVEDTACYRAGVLLSRYDVGFDSRNFSAPLDAFHEHCELRARHFPDNLLTTATHDCKRGEDTRARLAELSERAGWLQSEMARWQELAAPLRRQLPDGVAPSTADEYLIYQTLLGTWPPDLDDGDDGAVQIYLDRLLTWLQKALREAKLKSSWDAVNEDYEDACAAFITDLFRSSEGRPLREALSAAVATIAPAGALNSLSQCLLRMTTPGVPDLYQGTEFWDFSLVDPDNRRAVDFTARVAAFARDQDPCELIRRWRDGAIKQWLIGSLANTRRRWPHIFQRGAYLRLETRGAHAANIIAFARQSGKNFMVVVAPVRSAKLLGDAATPLVPRLDWQDTRVALPGECGCGEFVSALSGSRFHPDSGCLFISDVLADIPVDLLHNPMEDSQP